MGGKIIEIAGGSIITIAQKDISLYAETITFEAAKEVCFVGKEGGVKLGNELQEPPKKEAKDFDIKVELLKDHKTFLPLGIPDFEGKMENNKLKFKIEITGKGVYAWEFSIWKHEEKSIELIYRCFSNTNELDPVIVTADGKPKNSTDPFSYYPAPVENNEPKRFWPAGEYIIEWDGFDRNGIYSSKRLVEDHLTVMVKGRANGQEKFFETEKLEFKRAKEEWVDIQADKNTKTIQVMLRVNLTDGGAEGLGCRTVYSGAASASSSMAGVTTICDWDKIPANELKPGQPPIKTRTRSFDELVQLALDGLSYHWGRNKSHAVAKYVTINSEQWEVFVLPENTKEMAMKAVKLIYNTNGDWMRSGNPGTIEDPISWVGNIVSRLAVCYNVGYIKGSKFWGYQKDYNEDIEFKFTSAHEIGHTILKAYGGTIYSYGHKGSVNVVTQSSNENAILYPTSGEIDIMPYYIDDLAYSKYLRYVSAEKDVLGLISLTKISMI